MSDKKAAYDFVNKHGKEVAKTPGGNEKMGFREVGPEKDAIAAKAQAYMGDVPKGCNFADIQQGAMKK